MTSTNNNNKDKIKNVLYINGKEYKKNSDIKDELTKLADAKSPFLVSVRNETIHNKSGTESTLYRVFRITNSDDGRPISHVISDYFPTSGKQVVHTGVHVNGAFTVNNLTGITKQFIILAGIPKHDLVETFNRITSSKLQYNSQMFNTFVELAHPGKKEFKLSERAEVLRTLRVGGGSLENLIKMYMAKKKIFNKDDMPSAAEIKTLASRTYLIQGRDGKYTHSTQNRDGAKKSFHLNVTPQPVSGALLVHRYNPGETFVSKETMYVARFATQSASKAITARVREDPNDFYYVSTRTEPLVLHMPHVVGSEKTKIAEANEAKERQAKEFMEINGYVIGDKKKGGRGGNDDAAKFNAMRRDFALRKIAVHSSITHGVLVATKATLVTIANAYEDVRKAHPELPAFKELTENNMA